MTLVPGAHIGPYRIISRIGQGGMGEVWSAHDPRLGRDVAIKVSNEQFGERFGREAKAIAALNHPNICTLFDVGPNYLVMELVEGPTLAERIAKGAIPMEEAIAIARQIAGALEAAHEKGIVHRDLKPANIKLRNDGSVKVLDFGLAKSAESAEAASNSPTMVSTAGMILGTAGYMSPEQACGKVVDKRADIWSFGVVLHEMVTGKPTFGGETVSETLAAVIRGEPDWTRVPGRLQPLLRRCLDKDPKKRLRDISGMEFFLDAVPAAESEAPRERSLLAWIVAAVAVLAGAAVSFVHFREPVPDARAVFSTVSLPNNLVGNLIALSPDGRRMAVAAQGQIYIRSLDSPQFEQLANASGGRFPFWSADGRFIGFYADGKLKTIPAGGGPARSLCDAAGGSGTWNRDGVILFSQDKSILRVDASGGPCGPVSKPEPGLAKQLAVFLQDGRHYVYTAISDDESKRGVYVASLDNPAGRKILNDMSGVVYAPAAAGSRLSHLLFIRETTLLAQAFDEDKLQAAGDPWPITLQASFSNSPYMPAVSASTNGVLAFVSNLSVFDGQLAWFDRSGKELARVGKRHDQRSIVLSPDGKMIATMRLAGDLFSIWLTSAAGDSESRFAEGAGTAIWSPDGKKMMYWRSANGDLYGTQFSGGGQEAAVVHSGSPKFPSDWSRDSRFVLYTQIDPVTQGDIWYITDPMKPGGNTPEKFLGTNADEGEPQFSPDGRWVAYTSNESGRYEVYVRPFPSGPGQWKVSANGGVEPRWSPDGKEIYYIGPVSRAVFNAFNAFMAATVKPGRDSLEIGRPQMLFEARSVGISPRFSQFRYSVANDGRLLVNIRAETAEPTINLITNWQNLPAAKE